MVDILQLVLKALPATLTDHNGTPVAVTRGDLDERPLIAPPSLLAGIGSFSADPREQFMPGTWVESTPTVSEDHVVSGSDDVLLVEQDVVAILTVSGTVAGSPFEFNSTHYSLVAEPSDRHAKNTLRWLTATVPDDGTTLTVEYTHRLVEERFRSRRSDVFHVMLRVKATQKAAAGWAMYDDLVERVNAIRGRPLDANDPQAFVVAGIAGFGRLPVPSSEDVAEFMLQLKVSRYKEGLRTPPVRVAADFELEVESGEP